MKKRPSIRPTIRLLKWVWQRKIQPWFMPPICLLCRKEWATIRLGKNAWVCRRHELLVTGTQYGIRPKWRLWVYTKRGQKDLFKLVETKEIRKTNFWRNS